MNPKRATSCDAITEAQRLLPQQAARARTRKEFLVCSRWWELEAMRGYPSHAESTRYALNMRRAAGLVTLHGEGVWLDLLARGNGNAAERNPWTPSAPMACNPTTPGG